MRLRVMTKVPEPEDFITMPEIFPENYGDTEKELGKGENACTTFIRTVSKPDS